VANQGGADRNLGAGIKPILEELRDLRIEMRDLRIEMRADRQRTEEDRRCAEEDRRRSDEERRAFAGEQRLANARFERLMRDFREDSARRDAATQRALKDIRTVGFSIVKTLNHHTRILERIERKLGARDDGGPGANGGTSSRR
jgi:hypothetical protein